MMKICKYYVIICMMEMIRNEANEHVIQDSLILVINNLCF